MVHCQTSQSLRWGLCRTSQPQLLFSYCKWTLLPKFAEWAKQGEVGRRKLAQFTRYFTIVLAFIQSFAMSFGFNQLYGGSLITDTSIGSYLTIAIVLTAGTAFLLWLSEQITAHGVGNGISIIIFAGIVAAIPNAVNQIYAQQIEDAGDQLFINSVILALLVLVLTSYCCWSYLRSTSDYVKFQFNMQNELLVVVKS